jgi:hypothetical protein
LRAATPWLFADTYNPHAFCDAAFDVTDGQCMSHQLLLMSRRRGQPIWTPEELEAAWEAAYDKLYAEPGVYNPYLINDEELLDWRTNGKTARMLVEVCRSKSVAVHVVWSGALIESFVPETFDRRLTSPIAICIAGDHAYFYGDADTKRLIARMEQKIPNKQNPTRVSVEGMRETKRPPFSEWQELEFQDGKPVIEPGVEYYTPPETIHSIRLALHKQSICPRARLTGLSNIVGLIVPFHKQPSAYIYALPFNAFKCAAFAAAFATFIDKPFEYWGETAQTVTQRALDELMKPPKRQHMSTAQETALLDAQELKCASCGDELPRKAYELDHKIAAS